MPNRKGDPGAQMKDLLAARFFILAGHIPK
jgi:hypothetical protein